MGRAKLQLKFIQDQSRRLTAYRKRNQGLKKKARELAILCDVPVLVISFGPRGQVDVWPEDDQATRYIIENYSQLGADIRKNNQLDILSYMKAQISKHQASFNRRLRDLSDTPSLLLDDDTLDGTQGTLGELICKLDSKLGAIAERIQALKQQQHSNEGETMWKECNVEGQHLEELTPHDAIVGIQNRELMPHNGMVDTQNTFSVYDLMVSDPYVTMNASSQYPTLPMDHFNSGKISSNAFLHCPNYVPMGMGEESSAIVPSIPTSYVSPFAGIVSEYGSVNSDALPVPPLQSSIGLPQNHNLMVSGAAEQNHTNIGVAQNNVHHSDIGLAQNWMVSPMPTYVSSEPWPFASNPPIKPWWPFASKQQE